MNIAGFPAQLLAILVLQIVILFIEWILGGRMIPEDVLSSSGGEHGYNTFTGYILKRHTTSDLLKYVCFLYLLVPLSVGNLLTLPISLPVSTTNLQKATIIAISVVLTIFATLLFVWLISELSNKQIRGDGNVQRTAN